MQKFSKVSVRQRCDMFGYTEEKIRDFLKKHTRDGVPTVTQRQHYIPVHYLEAWRTGRKIAAKIGKNEPRMVGLRDAAVKSWCYEFAPLSLVELETIIDCAKPNFEYERKMLSMLIAVSVIPQLAGRIANNSKDGEAELMLNTIQSHGLLIPEAKKVFNIRYLATESNPDLANKGFELLRKEGGERYMTGLENSAWPYLKKARGGHIGFLREAKSGIRLIEYIFLQMFRTPKLDAVFNNAASGTEFSPDYAEHMIPYFRFIFAVKITCEAVAHFEDFEFRLVRNTSDCCFITSDYPFVHLDRESFYEFLFPISPKIALYMGRKGSMNKLYPYLVSPDRNAIVSINGELQRAAVNQTFACTCQELQ